MLSNLLQYNNLKATHKNIKKYLRLFIILVLGLLSFNSLKAQKKSYFDQDWNPCKAENAVYYSISEKEKGFHIQKDFYQNGQLQMRASFSDAQHQIKTGKHTYYHYNGQISLEKYYSNGFLDGPYIEYDYQGQIERKGTYRMGVPQGTWQSFEKGQMIYQIEYKGPSQAFYTSFYPSGSVKEKGALWKEKRNGKWERFYENGSPYISSYYDNNNRTGWWEILYPDGNKKGAIQFLGGKINKETYYHQNGSPLSAYGAHVLPQLAGGPEALAQFQSALQLPSELRHITGNVVLAFQVDAQGNLSQIKVIKSVHDELNRLAIEHLKKGNWQAGKIYHESLAIEHAISITIAN